MTLIQNICEIGVQNGIGFTTPSPQALHVHAIGDRRWPCSQPDSITAAASSKVGMPKALRRSICTVVSVSNENIISICSLGMGFLIHRGVTKTHGIGRDG